MLTIGVFLLQVIHANLQGKDVQQARLQGMSVPRDMSNAPPPQASKAPMLLQRHVLLRVHFTYLIIPSTQAS